MMHTQRITMKHLAFIALTAACAVAGCETSPLQADYGHSVAQMTDNQVYDRSASTQPSAAPVEGADPDMLNAAVAAMRIPPSDRKEVSKPLIINVGGQQ